MIAIAGWRTFTHDPLGPAMVVWTIALALNFSWSPIFFGLAALGVSALPMNIKARFAGFKAWAGARADIDRISSIWRECLDAYGGPYLFGQIGRASWRERVYISVVALRLQ